MATTRERERERDMATLTSISTPFLHPQSLSSDIQRTPNVFPINSRSKAFMVRAAKLPAGVVMPKTEPKLTEPFLGFTRTAETWNSRACMIGLVGIFIVELIFHKGILQMIGVDVGKGLNLPL